MDFQQLKSTIHTNGAAVCELQFKNFELQFKNHANEAAEPLTVPTDREEMVTEHVQPPAEHAEEAAARELQFKNFELQFKNHANEAAEPLTVPTDSGEMVTEHVQPPAEHAEEAAVHVHIPADHEEVVADHEEMPAAPLAVVTDRDIRTVVSDLQSTSALSMTCCNSRTLPDKSQTARARRASGVIPFTTVERRRRQPYCRRGL